MPSSKKIIVSVPENLLLEMDQMRSIDNKNRSEVIREAIKLYLGERRKRVLREQMQRGYVEMGEINKTIAEEHFNIDGDHGSTNGSQE
ncbi:MAG: CopG family ribbon-helix-helix protein [Chitinophagales bacterium]